MIDHILRFLIVIMAGCCVVGLLSLLEVWIFGKDK
jgi:hypothetical protein